MERIGIIFGSDNGNTEIVAHNIANQIEHAQVDCLDVLDANKKTFSKYQFLILGSSTWGKGALQSDWADFYKQFKKINFSGKVVALFGLGDQIGYGKTYVDAMGKLAKRVLANGGEIIGVTSTEGYSFKSSKAVFEKEWFMGLALDEDNQPELTQSRITHWVEQLNEEWLELTQPLQEEVY